MINGHGNNSTIIPRLQLVPRNS